MSNTYIFLLLILVTNNELYAKKGQEIVGPTLQQQLNQAHRNALCCAKKMRCCRKTAPPNVELRAVMARCTKPPLTGRRERYMKKDLNEANQFKIKNFEGFDEDEPLVQSVVTKCHKKVILTIKIKNQGPTNTKSQYIVIDHVYDSLSARTVHLLNPYIVKLKQEHVSQTYGLKFLDFINSNAREQVYNKHDGNFTGCSMDPAKSTCGVVKYHGTVIPYSEGFCCSCDAQKNAERQPETLIVPDPLIDQSDPAYLFDAVQCPRTFMREKWRNSTGNKVTVTAESSATTLTYSNDSNTSQDMKENVGGDEENAVDKANSHKVRELGDANRRRKPLKPKVKERHATVNKNRFSVLSCNAETKTAEKDNEEDERYEEEEIPLKNDYKTKNMNNEYEEIMRNNNNKLLEDVRSNYDRDSFTDSGHQDRIPAKQGHLQKMNHGKIINNNKKKMRKSSIIVDQENSKVSHAKKPSIHGLLLSTSKKPLGGFEKSIQDIGKLAFQSAMLNGSKRNFPYEHELNQNRETIARRSHVSKRQVQSSGVQKRGGQNCADRFTPPNLDPGTYHESAHCLRFSPVWYGVYKLNKPVAEQEIIIQIFEKYESQTGVIQWKDITNGKKVKLGTFYPFYQDEKPSISFAYEAATDDSDFCIDYNKYRLLIPEGIRIHDIEKYPEAHGGPSEYLILNANEIFVSGDQCDSAGVGFEAFYKQPNRCSMPRGSCLRHQPKHMWLHDKKMEKDNKEGCYFLKHYGNLAKNPIRRNETSGERFLTLNYYGQHTSIIEMEINADFNAVLRPQSSAVITEVYIDSTRPKTTLIIIKVVNSGLLASNFMVRIADCPLDVQGKLKEMTSKLVLISPQNQHIFKMNITNNFEADIFFCSVEALDACKEIVALRRIRIQMLDRCICTWHCLCACIGSSRGLKCVPMQIEHYHAAGFLGGLPVISYAQHVTIVDDILSILLYILLFILFTVFILGLTKALIGLCCAPIGMWGLNTLLDLPKPMRKYYEYDLRDRSVIYDDEGWPVHPDTKERVRNVPLAAEFCTNVLFFYTYPCTVLLLLFRKLCCPFCRFDRCRKKCGNEKTCDQLPKHEKHQDITVHSGTQYEHKDSHLTVNGNKEIKRKPTIKISIKGRCKSNPPKSPQTKNSAAKKKACKGCTSDESIKKQNKLKNDKNGGLNPKHEELKQYRPKSF